MASKEDGGRDGDANTKDDEKCEETEKMNRDVAEICLGAEAAAIMTGRVFFLPDVAIHRCIFATSAMIRRCDALLGRFHFADRDR